ncbi:MAG: class II aldolase/adducin family protein [Eubacterium sp.]|nr:class II aldolase/adducin family protein [Eubacterium sp.]
MKDLIKTVEEYKAKEEICAIGKRILASGMVAANDGNISVRLSKHEILCTPTGVSKGYMKPEMICKVDEKGNLLEAEGGYRPSSEVKMHLRVYEKRPDVTAVVHTHAPFATTFAIMGTPIDEPITTEAVVSLGEVPLAPFALPGTMEVPDSIEPFLQDYDAVLLRNHGVLTYSETLEEAYLKMEEVEFFARLVYQTKMLGGAKPFKEDVIQKLYDIRRNSGMKGRHPALSKK